MFSSSMLKDMVKGLEQINCDKKEKAETARLPETNNNPKKPEPKTGSKCAHAAAEGNPSAECVCYYCTLFGKNVRFRNFSI